MDLLFVEYPKCSTCQKARKWLDAQGAAYKSRHIVKDNPSADELRAWWQASDLPLRRFFNTSGILYRELGVKAQLDAGMSDDETLNLLATNGMLVKRPILVIEDGGATQVLVGFKESEWEKALA